MTQNTREHIVGIFSILGILLTLGLFVWPLFTADGSQGYWLAFALPCYAVSWESFAAKRGYGQYLWGMMAMTFVGCVLVGATHWREILDMSWMAVPVLMLIALAMSVALFWRSRPAAA